MLLVALSLCLGAGEHQKLAVIDLVDQGGGPETAKSLTDVVTATLTGLGVLDVLSRADIQQMVAFEEQKQMMGCDGEGASCLAELGGALGVALLVTGNVGKVGETFILNLTLIDSKTVRVVSREQRQVASATELTQEAAAAARFLVRSLLEGQQGDLVLRVSELGADVEIDGRIVGATPLQRLTIAGGPHRVRVSKNGFVSWARDVDIQKDDAVVLEASLVPSLEHIAEYDERAGMWRRIAYVTLGAGVLLAGYGATDYFVLNARRADDFESDVLTAHCEAGSTTPSTADCTSFVERRDSIERRDLIAGIAGLTGVLALGAGAYLHFAGPEPGIYDQYKPSATLVVVPQRDGAMGAVSWRF